MTKLSPHVIGLCGYTGAGKDTVADILVEDHGYLKIAFADSLRDFLLEANPVIGHNRTRVIRLREEVQDKGWDRAKRDSGEVRRLMQAFGQGVRDSIGDDAWIRAAAQKTASGQPDRIVFSDVRYRNEIAFLQSVGAKFLWVDRPNARPLNNHPSELDIDPQMFRWCIPNNKDIDHLREVIARYIEFIEASPREFMGPRSDRL